jgi:hypothetical protein
MEACGAADRRGGAGKQLNERGRVRDCVRGWVPSNGIDASQTREPYSALRVSYQASGYFEHMWTWTKRRSGEPQGSLSSWR